MVQPVLLRSNSLGKVTMRDTEYTHSIAQPMLIKLKGKHWLYVIN